jgi:hypothetical protein
LGLCADPLHCCATLAHLLCARSTSFGDFALYTHRQSYLCGARLAARGQSRHLAGFRCPCERRAGINFPSASTRICLDARCRGCGANSPRRFRRRARRQAGRPRRSRWAGRTNAPGHCLCRADDGGDSAKRCGHRSAATRKKRARPIGNTSAARRARRGTDAVDRARARAAAVTASTVTASIVTASTAAAKCWRANAATGLRFALGAAADHDGADDYRADDCTHANSIHDAARSECAG